MRNNCDIVLEDFRRLSSDYSLVFNRKARTVKHCFNKFYYILDKPIDIVRKIRRDYI